VVSGTDDDDIIQLLVDVLQYAVAAPPRAENHQLRSPISAPGMDTAATPGHQCPGIIPQTEGGKPGARMHDQSVHNPLSSLSLGFKLKSLGELCQLVKCLTLVVWSWIYPGIKISARSDTCVQQGGLRVLPWRHRYCQMHWK